jgi:hypothetical protein
MTMQPSYDNPLNGIVEGMPVYDSNGERIGVVAEIHFGGQEADAYSGRSKSAAEDIRRAGRGTETEEANAFNGDVSEEIAEQLTLNGYIRVEGSGLTGAAAYIMPDRIGLINDGQVKLASSLQNLREYPHPGKGERNE